MDSIKKIGRSIADKNTQNRYTQRRQIPKTNIQRVNSVLPIVNHQFLTTSNTALLTLSFSSAVSQNDTSLSQFYGAKIYASADTMVPTTGQTTTPPFADQLPLDTTDYDVGGFVGTADAIDGVATSGLANKYFLIPIGFTGVYKFIFTLLWDTLVPDGRVNLSLSPHLVADSYVTAPIFIDPDGNVKTAAVGTFLRAMVTDNFISSPLSFEHLPRLQRTLVVLSPPIFLVEGTLVFPYFQISTGYDGDGATVLSGRERSFAHLKFLGRLNKNV